jgi:hypothetical protein
VVPATQEHAEALAPNLRSEDVDEVWAASQSTPLEALETGLRLTNEPSSVLVDGEPIAMFGVASVITGLGAPWLLGARAIEEHRWEFLRRSRVELARIRRPFARLTNYVDARNHTHIRWLEWLGARFIHLDPSFGHENRPFWLFEL